ncbi:MAG: PilZ domain-containing protein [Magnetococcales bacterium]|nr:PilZ domain-containing protein [Magnetococcales bacterium]NGZ04915.1 PilZ domain-containing protein [Magnetococcales bacterium]
MEKGLHGQANVLEILHRAVQERVLLEVRIDGEEKSYGARLLSLSEDLNSLKKHAADLLLSQYASKVQQSSGESSSQEQDPRWILMTPLEPPDGNLRIRKSARVVIGFCLGLEMFRTVVTFRRVQRVESGQAIELSWPPAFQISTKRQQMRVEIPADMKLEIQVHKKGADPFVVPIFDISPGGLSFTSAGLPVSLESGDRVGLSIIGEILMGTPINIFGTITAITKVRDSQDVQVARQLYGVKFVMLSVADAMSVDRLVETIETITKGGSRTGAGRPARKRHGV